MTPAPHVDVLSHELDIWHRAQSRGKVWLEILQEGDARRFQERFAKEAALLARIVTTDLLAAMLAAGY
jgi:hypothetical protein